MVLAGREAPALAWRTDVAWAPLTRIIELGNFAPGESVAFLESRGVAAGAHANALDFTHGHPLALSLVADVLAARPDTTAFDPRRRRTSSGICSALFLDTVPAGRLRERSTSARWRASPTRAAADGSARRRGGPRAPSTGCAAVLHRERSAGRVSARPGAGSAARRRALARRRAACRRLVAADLLRALHGTSAARAAVERQRLQMDALYVTRTRPTNAVVLRLARAGRCARGAGGARRRRLDRRARAIGTKEPASADLRPCLVARAACGISRVPRGRRRPIRLPALLDIGEAGPAMAVRDPRRRSRARRSSSAMGRCGRGEGVVYLRWWMHAEAYQAVTAAINLTAMHVVSHCVTRPGIAWNFVAMADPSFWAAHFEGVNFARVPEADFEVAGRRYGVFAHDWRIEPPADWMMGARIPMPFVARPRRRWQVAAVLGEADFQHAVRAALRDYTRPDALADSPLRFARAAGRAARDARRAGAFRSCCARRPGARQPNPRDAKLYRAVWHTYFEPLDTPGAGRTAEPPVQHLSASSRARDRAHRRVAVASRAGGAATSR